MTMRRSGTLVLVLSVLAFAGSAYAGNDNGNGNGKGNGNGGVAADASPGNSASAPGQVKKDEAPPAPESTTTVVTTTTAAAADANASGVKPSNTTAHDTHAEAQSDKTKVYGNGQTAGQIAEQNGAPATTVLHGPGNSQPHKATPCSGGHEVDVHALKSHRSHSCGGDPAPKPNPKPNDPPVVTTTTTTSSSGGLPKQDNGDDPAPQSGSHGIAGYVASSSGHETQSVLSATQAVGRLATLPFTGQPLWAAVLAGLLLIATGAGLRQIRSAEARVESERDHTDRSRHASARSRRSFGGRAGR
jgi:hypothetical protein